MAIAEGYTPATVLVFDDDVEQGNWRGSILASRLGVDVTVGSRQEEIVTRLLAHRYDLLIVDSISRSDDPLHRSGSSILKRGILGYNSPNDQTPVIIYTRSPVPGDLRDRLFNYRNVVTIEQRLSHERLVAAAADILGLAPSAGLADPGKDWAEPGEEPRSLQLDGELLLADPGAPDAVALQRTQELGLLGPDGAPVGIGSAEQRQLLLDVREVSVELLDALAENPLRLHGLDGHKFELVVADLLEHKGYDVEVVRPGPDGGVDIYAAKQSDLGSFLYLVQCKRWKPEHAVGIDVVQRLYGRVSEDNATAGVVVTTSRFTTQARKTVDRLPFRMALRDFHDLVAWLSYWRTTRLGRKP